MDPLVIVVALVAVALLFDYINGFHDAANSIATVVSTRCCRRQGVIWAAFFNFVAAFAFGTAVAATVGKGMTTSGRHLRRDPGRPDRRDRVDLLTWYFGLPTSSSHALIGGYAGAAVTKAGWVAITGLAGWQRGWGRTLPSSSSRP